MSDRKTLAPLAVMVLSLLSAGSAMGREDSGDASRAAAPAATITYQDSAGNNGTANATPEKPGKKKASPPSWEVVLGDVHFLLLLNNKRDSLTVQQKGDASSIYTLSKDKNNPQRYVLSATTPDSCDGSSTCMGNPSPKITSVTVSGSAEAPTSQN